MKLYIVHCHFPADSPLRKNHVQDLYPASHKPLEPFCLSFCGIRAGAKCHGRPRTLRYQALSGLGQIAGLWFIFDNMPEEKNLINQRKYMSAISAKDQK